jgi:hypothetical protein
MNRLNGPWPLLAALGLMAGLTTMAPCRLDAQPVMWPVVPQVTPDGQRNALNNLRAQATWLQNATRTAPNFRTGAYDQVWQQFQLLREAFRFFASTLSQRQLAAGANDLAELNAGLDILQEAFVNYQQDVAAGQFGDRALRNMCQVLGRATGVWVQELNRASTRLRVGWP